MLRNVWIHKAATFLVLPLCLTIKHHSIYFTLFVSSLVYVWHTFTRVSFYFTQQFARDNNCNKAIEYFLLTSLLFLWQANDTRWNTNWKSRGFQSTFIATRNESCITFSRDIHLFEVNRTLNWIMDAICSTVICANWLISKSIIQNFYNVNEQRVNLKKEKNWTPIINPRKCQIPT